MVLAVGIVAAGSPGGDATAGGSADALDQVVADIDPSTFPAITVDQDVVDWNHEIDAGAAREIVLTLVQNLQVENQALLSGDAGMLERVDHGDRLDAMRARLEASKSSGTTVVEQYRIDDVTVTLLVPFGKQDGLSLGLESSGTVTSETYDGGVLQSTTSSPFSTTFAMRRATGARWLNVGEFPGTGS
jgi:hypothetical protein